MVGRNVAILTEPPRGPKYEIKPLEPEEARRFLATVKGDRLEALYSVALAFGLRQGEALGLRWQDVDLDRGRMRVVHQLQRVDSKLALVDLKTELSRRTIVLPASTWLKLRQHHDRQQEEKAAAGRNWQDLVGPTHVEGRHSIQPSFIVPTQKVRVLFKGGAPGRN